MRLKDDSVLGHAPTRGEREDLISAGVGENRSRPAREGVKPAQPGDAIVAGTHVQVVRVRQQDVRAKIAQGLDRDGLDGTARADRHEGRSLDDAVWQMQATPTRASVTGKNFEPEAGAHGA